MKKVLFLGFTPVQMELARKFIAFRNLAKEIEVIPEQRSSVQVDAYLVNGDDPSAANSLALYTRLNPKPAMGVGSRAVLGVTTYVSGPFKPATADRLAEMLYNRPPSAPAAAPVSNSPNVLSFPGHVEGNQADVLVVDDSEIVRRTMVRKINEYGHKVDSATSGEDAMAMLLSNRYKLVFLDVMMPGLDGFDVCKRIKKSAEYKASAVYLLTSRDGMFDKVRGSMAGCDGYLVKPLESRKLREVLDLYFDRPSRVGESDIARREPFNPAELAAIEGTPPADLLAAGAGGIPEPAVPRDFAPTFAPTMPAPLDRNRT